MKKNVVLIAFTIILLTASSNAQLSLLKNNIDYSDNEKVSMMIDYMVSTYETDSFNVDEYIKESEILLNKVDNDSLRAVLLLLNGKMHHLRGEYPKATGRYIEALNYYEELGNKVGIANCYRNLGETYRAANSLRTALDYLYKAKLIYLNDVKDSNLIARTFNRISAVYFELHDTVKTFENAYSAVNYAKKYTTEGKNVIANTYNILGAIQSEVDHAKALEYFTKSVDLFKSIGHFVDLPNLYINMAVIYSSKGDYKNALKYSNEAFQLAKKYDIVSYISASLRILSDAHFQLDNYKIAYELLKESNVFRENLINERKNQQLIEIRTKLEIEEKEKQLKLQESLRIYQGIMLAIVILIILFFALKILFRNQTLKKKNYELADKNDLITYQNSRLAELNATKDKFFSIIAHDLKNPLSSIKLVSNSLRDNYSSLSEDEKLEFITEIRKSSNHIIELLDNLLTWSRSQTGRIVFEAVEFPIRSLVQNNINLLANQANAKMISLENNTLESALNGDPNMINTVLRNLISNAIKFTPHGGNVIVRGEQTELDKQTVYLVSVEDNGVGISADKIQKLFKIDSGFSTHGTDDEKGTGLGLILCKEFIDMHKGKIWAESVADIGTKISFTIPIIENNPTN